MYLELKRYQSTAANTKTEKFEKQNSQIKIGESWQERHMRLRTRDRKLKRKLLF